MVWHPVEYVFDCCGKCSRQQCHFLQRPKFAIVYSINTFKGMLEFMNRMVDVPKRVCQEFKVY
jgi:hypothetical protein